MCKTKEIRRDFFNQKQKIIQLGTIFTKILIYIFIYTPHLS